MEIDGKATIYLDHAATTPLGEEVLEAMLPFYRKIYGNPSSIHGFGQQAAGALEEARGAVASAIGAEPEEICFTGGGSESDNLAIKGVAYAGKERRSHLITSQIEHPAVLNSVRELEQDGFSATYLPVDRAGIVEVEALAQAVTESTSLVTVMLANNEVGSIQPVGEIARLAAERGALVHTDAIQALGKMSVDVDELGVDLLSISAHKVGGPKGVGALYIRKGTRIRPLIHGGAHENNRRAGTQNVAGIVGFAKAMTLAENERHANTQRLADLRNRLWEGISSGIEGTSVNGHPTKRLVNIVNVAFESVEAEAILIALDLNGDGVVNFLDYGVLWGMLRRIRTL